MPDTDGDRRIDDATADLSMAAAQKRFLRERVMAERPSDVAGYVRTFAETWGIKTVNPAPASNGAALPGQAPQPGAAFCVRYALQ